MNLRPTAVSRPTLAALILTGIVVIVGTTMIISGLARSRLSGLAVTPDLPAGNQEEILPDSGRNITPTWTLPARVTPLTGSVLVKNCTYTSDYWQAHPDIWLAENMIIGKFSYAKPDALAILQNATPDLATSILKQFITAVLNTLNGADAAPVQPFLNDASDWLTANINQPVISAADQEKGLSLAQNLESYNQGILGPGLCPDQPATLTPTPSLTPTPTPTPTPAYIPAPFTETPTSTERSGGGGSSGGQPPAPTVAPSNPPPTNPPPVAPTTTPAPQPTLPPPTSTPEPTQPLPTSPPEPTKEHKPTHTPRPTPTSPAQPPPTNTSQLFPSSTPEPTDGRKPTHTPKSFLGFEFAWIPFDLFSAL